MKIKKIIVYLTIISLTVVIFILSLNFYVNETTKRFINSNITKVPDCYTALVLGACISQSGYPSDVLQDRLETAIELYKDHKVKRFLLSGDHGTKDYDEVNNMKKYLIKNGINTKDIFLDHAGFDTYNSIVRAQEIFQVNDVLIVTQEFHLPRAIYIARLKHLKAFGIIADKVHYESLPYLKLREKLAMVKAFFEVLIDKSPTYLGEKIPITGDSRLSYD